MSRASADAPGIRAYGREALLVEVGDVDAMVSARAQVAAAGLAGVTDVLPGARSILVRFDRDRVSGPRLAADVRRVLSEPSPQQDQAEPPPARVVSVVYDGPDLQHVADVSGLTPAEVVSRHLDGRYVVAFLGFSPGFYFLGGTDPALSMPRRPSPRTDVARGAVALAGEFTGIYPRRSPGGWQIIGHTPDALWHHDRFPAARLAPGTPVRFAAVAPA